MGQLAVCLRGSHAERAYQRRINRRGVMSHTSESPEEMQHLVARIARAVVDNSRHVIVEASDYQGGTWLRVQVARSDIPKVIGQQRRTVGALRALLAAVTKKQHHLYMLDVCEEMKNRVVDAGPLSLVSTSKIATENGIAANAKRTIRLDRPTLGI